MLLLLRGVNHIKGHQLAAALGTARLGLQVHILLAHNAAAAVVVVVSVVRVVWKGAKWRVASGAGGGDSGDFFSV